MQPTGMIFETRTGSPEIPVPLESGSWEARLGARNGSGQHTVPLFGAGIPQPLIDELSTGNKYTFAQCWGEHVSFAGVIQDRVYEFDTNRLVISSTELRSAYMDSRLLYGVGSDTTADGGVVLAVSSKSQSGAARAVIDKATTLNGASWELPIDLPADGSGSFTASWEYEERLNWEDHIRQIEKDGCEVDFRPYLDGGYLRWETRVSSAVTSGSATDLAAKAPGSRVAGLRVRDNYSRQVTGVRGYGKDGAVKFAEYGGTTPISVRDVWVNFNDIDEPRLQAAVDAEFNTRVTGTRQWSFGLNVWPMGPELAAPGRLLNLAVYGDPFIADGKHPTRVVSVRGDLGFNVRVEAQSA